MATIRIPESAEPLLPFCRTSGTSGPHIWETYADMITFLASYAYGNDETPSGKPTPLKSANPIDLGVFRSRGLYAVLLTLAIADQRDWLIAKKPDEIAASIEAYAAAGARLVCLPGRAMTAEMLCETLLVSLKTGITPSFSIAI